jgi:methylenetetrahydrofolate dehydrogenase (NADP+)/methenyltetrahydrofolate cyclohydrolase
MAATIMDGKSLAVKIKEEISREVETRTQRPGLAVVLVGDDQASQVYVQGRKKDCQQCGFYSEEYVLPGDTTQEELVDLLGLLNGRKEIDGIIVQFPLPKHLDSRAVEAAIGADKDVDCVNPVNMGHLMLGQGGFWPCTPAGVMRLLEEYHIDPAGKHCVVVGRSNIVGKPQAMLLLGKNATVTICHSKTKDLAYQCHQADILVAAVGRAGLITADMVREGAVVIDVGMNRNQAGKLCGDVDFDPVAEKASYITPVPGGTGPMTRAMLLENTLLAAKRHGK